jgi:hypothetical protein
MKTHFTLLLALCCFSLKAQMTSTQVNNELAGKEWLIVKYETFGVEEEPKAEQVKDKVVFNKDKTFFIIENGKEYHGKWMVQSEINIVCKSQAGEWSRTYKVISIAEKTATIEYQDADLTRTLYRLELK